MASLDDDLRRELGRHLRGLRRARGLTLAELSAEVEVSTSALSQMERGVIEPSLGTLWRLNDILGTSLFDFFQQQTRERVQLCRKDQRGSVVFDGYTYETLVHTAQRQLDLFFLRITPSDEPVRPPIAHYGEECGLVTAGTLEVRVDGETHVLHRGDSIWFDSNLPHTFRAVGRGECTSIWTNTLPGREGLPGALLTRLPDGEPHRPHLE